MQEEQSQQAVSAPTAQVVALRELGDSKPDGTRVLGNNMDLIAGVKVKVEVVVGGTELTVQELFSLQQGAVLPLQQLHDTPLAVRLDGRTIARGTLVVVGDNFGVCITDVLPADSVRTE
jgi:flagellar motor switch protein FliN